MNDQRNVIFSQRLKILKSKNVKEILADFFDESIIKLENTKTNYEKTNDKKAYITSTKDLIGNILSDDELIESTKLKKDEFIEKFKNLFISRQNERIKTIGEEQNNEIEKRILLQVIDFSWRSHLQYLEEVRQVIGLRSYGQKDPLSEFKKEAFTLFEILLDKIKLEIIKFLINLNVVISEEKKENSEKKDLISDNKKVGRNDKCPCGSGKKFKHCHGSI